MKFVLRFLKGKNFVTPKKVAASSEGVDFAVGHLTIRVPLQYSPFAAKGGITVTAQDWPDAYTCLTRAVNKKAHWNAIERAYVTDDNIFVWMEEA